MLAVVVTLIGWLVTLRGFVLTNFSFLLPSKASMKVTARERPELG